MPSPFAGSYPHAMRYKTLLLRAIVLSITSAAIVPAHASDEDECSLLVRGCLSRPTETRDICFESSSASPACIGSQIGEIAAKRSHFAPMMPRDEDGGPAFLGPQAVDRTCLENFDRQLELILDMGPLTSERRRTLSSQLDRCNQMAPSDLYRP
jgi:hypothetical protein